MTEEKAKRISHKYYAVVFGADPDPDAEKKPTIDGHCEVFTAKVDLDTWLTTKNVRMHDRDNLAGQCIMQLPDGRAVMILKGHAKTLKKQLSIW